MKRLLLTLALALFALPALAQTGGWSVMGTPTFLQQIQGPQRLDEIGSTNDMVFDDPVLGVPLLPWLGSNWVTFHWTCATNFPPQWQYFDYQLLQSDDGVNWNYGIEYSFGTNALHDDLTYWTTYPNYPPPGTNTPQPLVQYIGTKPQYYTVLLNTYTNGSISPPADYTFYYNTNCYGCTPVSTNVAGDLLWETNGVQLAGYNSIGLAVAADTNGNSAFGGYMSGTGLIIGTNNLTGNGGLIPSGIVVYTDSSGNVIWARSFMDNGSSLSGEQVTGLAFDSGGNLYVAGLFTTNVDFGGISLTAELLSYGNQPDGFLAKYSSSGTLLWVEKFGGPYDDQTIAVAVDSSDNVLITGKFTSPFVDFGGGHVITHGGGNWNTYVAKLAGSNGACIWANGITASDAQSTCITVDGSGNAIVGGGFYNGNLAQFSGTTGAEIWRKATGGTVNGVAVHPSNGNIATVGVDSQFIFLRCYSSSGTTNWQIYNWNKAPGFNDENSNGYGVAYDASGNLTFGGVDSGGNRFTNCPFAMGNGSRNGFMVSYATTGTNFPTYRWQRHFGYGVNGNSTVHGIATMPNGKIVISGYVAYTIDFGGKTVTVPSGYTWIYGASYKN